ncbi:YicC/YloC family endoribonuclease, partial [Ochrobactrum sp. SFR4]|uniref:YicC/YloC family endoribonuclease n=1 Tax=Ochrobactrum sp. SFR4 TaxID=2717368 RepID=UPI00336A71AC
MINEALLSKVMQTALQLQNQYGLAPASVDAVLNLKGILEPPQTEADEAAKAALKAALLSSFDEALEALKQMRLQEGKRL